MSTQVNASTHIQGVNLKVIRHIVSQDARQKYLTALARGQYQLAQKHAKVAAYFSGLVVGRDD